MSVMMLMSAWIIVSNGIINAISPLSETRYDDRVLTYIVLWTYGLRSTQLLGLQSIDMDKLDLSAAVEVGGRPSPPY